MGYSMKDMESAGRNLNQYFEDRSQQKGEEIAQRLIQRTSQGRGLWVLLLWPAWLLIFVFSGYFFSTGLEQQFVLRTPVSYLGFVGGIVYAVAWYQWSFTRNHPFWSTIFGYFGTALGVVCLAAHFGW